MESLSQENSDEDQLNEEKENDEEFYKLAKPIFYNSKKDPDKKPIDIDTKRSTSNDDKAPINKMEALISKEKQQSKRKFKFFNKKNKNKNKKYKEKLLFESENELNMVLDQIEEKNLSLLTFEDNKEEKYKIYYNNFELKSKAPKNTTFQDLMIHKNILENLSAKMTINKVGPLQRVMIPLIFGKKNTLVCEDHEKGKTLAFLMTILSQLLNDNLCRNNYNTIYKPVCILIYPTKELVEKAYLEAQYLAYKTKVTINKIYHDESKKNVKEKKEKNAEEEEKRENKVEEKEDEEEEKEIFDGDKMKFKCDILIGTPEKFEELLSENLLNLSYTQYILIEECDKMLDTELEETLNNILNYVTMTNRKCLKLFFSSSILSQKVVSFSEQFVNYLYLITSKENKEISYPKSTIKQSVFSIEEDEKIAKLHSIFQEIEGKAIIFMNKKKRVDELQQFLEERNYNVMGIHGDKSQKMKFDTINMFWSGEVPILIATDLVSREMILPPVQYIFNFDMPNNIEDFVFRLENIKKGDEKATCYSFFTKSNGNIATDLAVFFKKLNYEIPGFFFEHIKDKKKINYLKDIEDVKNKEFKYKKNNDYNFTNYYSYNNVYQNFNYYNNYYISYNNYDKYNKFSNHYYNPSSY